MTKLIFPCTEHEHPMFGKVTRPLIKLSFYSERFQEWLNIKKVLVDTGADLSVIPLPLGQILFSEIESGQPMQLGGILSSDLMINAFIHNVQTKIGDYIFEMPLAVSSSKTIPPILGRQQALDRFIVSFIHGKELILES